jgi:transmembrane sensor
MGKFRDLLQRFSKNTASQQEAEEFLRMSHDNDTVSEIEKHMDNMLARHDVRRGLDEDESRETLQHIFANGRTPVRATAFSRLWMAAAAFGVVMAAAALWLYMNNSTLQEETYTFSGKHYLRLPDGSGVTLKEGSSLTYKQSFKNNREVALSGEAFFDVTPDPEKPFRVHTGKVITTVLGTAFNINASRENAITVTVTRGKVVVGDDTREYGTIMPNEQLAVNTISHQSVKTPVDTATAVRWKKDYFILDRVTIAEAARQIGKRFNVEVHITNKDLEHCVITTWFLNNEGLDHIVESVSAVCQARYTIDDGSVTIEGGVGCD